MKRIFNYLIVLSFLVTACWSQAAEFTLPKYQKFSLKNGLTLYLLEQHEVPLIDVLVTVKAGAVQDNQAGQAMLTADSLLLGTTKLAKPKFEQTMDFVGAQVSSGANLEYSYVKLSMAKVDQDNLLPVLRDVLLSPAFEQAEFDKHKTRYLAQLEQQKESPRQVIKSYFNEVLYAGHPYASSVDGTSASVTAIDLANVKQFHAKWYQPNNSAIVITGDFDSKAMKAKIEKLFADWQGKAPEFTLDQNLPTPSEAKVLLVNKSDANESTFMIGGVGIKRSNPDYVALSVINTVLGARFTSWLNDELRVNSGLTYGAGSRFDSHLAGGSFYISTFTKTESTNEAMDLALSTYARLWEKGIDEATLASAKAYVKGLFPPKYETSEDLAWLLSEMFIYGFDEGFINNFSKQVNSLDIKRSKQLIDTYFPQDKLQFVVVGKADDIRDKLSKYGKLSETDIK
ncbi:M16 family metallopeptidase [Paraglaciecola hydrolytica]|uniref:Peptidase M16 n=1 Tax=Paraglaciecola hydrolytica TaxID=1799789 RepID=A0A135ZZ01_9ALTE|nr:pitrilysin family protein [Paraglaciecola hydrolytica]KXI28187.1 peptidase M16 [Paraglaciecola hydrolytica]